MATKKQFFVSLEGVDLTDEQLKNIDRGIQNVVLSELSKVDNAQALHTAILRNSSDRYR